MLSRMIAVLALTLGVAVAPLAAQEKKDIVDTAVAAGKFKTLATALTAADLVPVLKGPGPFTVFAPTDEAFAKLPPGTLEALLKDKAKLTAVLTYHVVPGTVKAADVVKLDSAKTVQGAKVDIAVRDGKVSVNNANVIAVDIAASNGVIHVIDAVLLPPTTSGQAAPGSSHAPAAIPCNTTQVHPIATSRIRIFR